MAGFDGFNISDVSAIGTDYEPPTAWPGPLGDADARVARAGMHLDALRDAVAVAGSFQAEVSFGRTPEEPHKTHLGMTMTADSFDPPLGVLIGETLYNLRAALDYIVYALAVANNDGNHVSGTQFPIEDTPEMFDARVTGKLPDTTGEKPRRVAPFLRKVPPEHVEAIRVLQPFAGCPWTGPLRELQKPDKHRQLLTSTRRLAIDLPPHPWPADGIHVIRRRLEEFDGFAVVFVESGDPIVQTLELFHAEVGIAVDSFKSAFDLRSAAQD